MKFAVLALGIGFVFNFHGACKKTPFIHCEALADAKYWPINPSVDFLENPLNKPEHGTDEVTESLKKAFC